MFDRIPCFIRKIVPLLLCVLIILLSQIPDARFFCVPLVFIPIFFFSFFYGHLLNVYMVFALGLFADLINQTPFGLFSFVFMLLFFVTRLNRQLLRELSFKSTWLAFTALTGILLLVQLFIFVLCEGSFVHTKFLFEQFVVVVLLYPMGIVICNHLNNWIGTDI